MHIFFPDEPDFGMHIEIYVKKSQISLMYFSKGYTFKLQQDFRLICWITEADIAWSCI